MWKPTRQSIDFSMASVGHQDNKLFLAYDKHYPRNNGDEFIDFDWNPPIYTNTNPYPVIEKDPSMRAAIALRNCGYFTSVSFIPLIKIPRH